MTGRARKSKRDAVCIFSAMAERLGVATVPAAWPSRVVGFAQAIAVCKRCNEDKACTDRLARAPGTIAVPPAFCPNARVLVAAKSTKR